MYFVYLVECSDKTIYCGVAKDLSRRIKEHNGILKGGARYTSGRRPVKLIYSESVSDYSKALKREIEIKKMKRSEKLRILR